MRRERGDGTARWRALVLPALVTLSLWLVVQNAVLLAHALENAPAAVTVARALFKVAVRLAAPVLPALAIFAGAWILWTSDRPEAGERRVLEEARHG